MIKNTIKLVLQRLFGFENYLYIFSIFIIKKLRWDKNEKDFLFFLDLLPNEGIVLDIGSNIGVMSYYLAKQKNKAHIYAFEPLAANYKNHHKLIERYRLPNIKIEKYALGAEAAEIEMVMPVVNSVKMHGLSHVVHPSITEYNKGNLYKVPLKKLDDLSFLNNGLPVKGIKIDVENFEYFALKGGLNIIKRDKPIIYAELWPGENRNNTFKMLKSIGYFVKVIENKKLVDFTHQQKQNFIFLMP